MAKKIDPKAKAKRQKIYAGIGGVILLAVLAFQVPRTLKLLHQSNANASSATSSSSSTTTPTTTGPIVPPSLGGGNATPTASAVSADGVSDPGLHEEWLMNGSQIQAIGAVFSVGSDWHLA